MERQTPTLSSGVVVWLYILHLFYRAIWVNNIHDLIILLVDLAGLIRQTFASDLHQDVILARFVSLLIDMRFEMPC